MYDIQILESQVFVMHTNQFLRHHISLELLVLYFVIRKKINQTARLPPPGQFLRLPFCHTTERAHVINRLCFLLEFISPCTLARYLIGIICLTKLRLYFRISFVTYDSHIRYTPSSLFQFANYSGCLFFIFYLKGFSYPFLFFFIHPVDSLKIFSQSVHRFAINSHMYFSFRLIIL